MLENLPEKLLALISTAQLDSVSEGESDARVYRLSGETIRYLKVNSLTAHFPVKDDTLRLQWLEGKIAVPEVLHYEENASNQYLLMSDCPGLHPFHDDLDWTIEERIAFLAQSARKFHSIPIDDCPFQMNYEAQIDRAQFNIEKKRLRENGRLEDNIANFGELKPQNYDPVITHGDMYPVNIRVDEAQHTINGFIDVGAMAAADRYTDLAPIVNAIGWHYDKKWITPFFDLYGIAINEEKLRFYQAIHPFL